MFPDQKSAIQIKVSNTDQKLAMIHNIELFIVKMIMAINYL